MDKFNKLLKKFRKICKELISASLMFLCLGVIVQLLIDDTILGWNPVKNIQDAGSAFIGVIAFVLLYILFINKK